MRTTDRAARNFDPVRQQRPIGRIALPQVFGTEAEVSILTFLVVTVAVFGVLGFVQRMVERL
ncbi:hypothetical protein [Nocardia grenadensis]|uniref:hypothetical protein n=1 Tax=Nocardia grenadensis TaxID=931537 RepID=UPI0007A4F969|nr:hypothetical protein [Nocardia grenadensis]